MELAIGLWTCPTERRLLISDRVNRLSLSLKLNGASD